MKSYFEKFWSEQSDPLHTSADEEYLNAYGDELAMLLPKNAKAVLDLGCGTGTFYKRLNFDKAQVFTGVDFSQKMLGQFRHFYGDDFLNEEKELICADASKFLDDKQYDLIFSNSVVQNFSVEMFESHLDNAYTMLNSEGVLVIGSILWKTCEHAFASGEAKSSPHFNPFWKTMLIKCSTDFKRNGRWYSEREILSSCEARGFEVKFYGSLHYRYRIHAVCTKKNH